MLKTCQPLAANRSFLIGEVSGAKAGGIGALFMVRGELQKIHRVQSGAIRVKNLVAARDEQFHVLRMPGHRFRGAGWRHAQILPAERLHLSAKLQHLPGVQKRNYILPQGFFLEITERMGPLLQKLAAVVDHFIVDAVVQHELLQGIGLQQRAVALGMMEGDNACFFHRAIPAFIF